MKKEKYLTVETLSDKESKVAQWFENKYVYFIGSHSGCSCGFPHVIAEEPITYYEGMFDEDESSEDDLKSIIELIQLLEMVIPQASNIILYPAWYDAIESAPRGTIELSITGINPRHFFFNEGFMYNVSAEPPCVWDGEDLAAPNTYRSALQEGQGPHFNKECLWSKGKI